MHDHPGGQGMMGVGHRDLDQPGLQTLQSQQDKGGAMGDCCTFPGCEDGCVESRQPVFGGRSDLVDAGVYLIPASARQTGRDHTVGGSQGSGFLSVEEPEAVGGEATSLQVYPLHG